MTLNYYDTKNLSPLAQELFSLSFNLNDLPFESTILPICNTSLTYIYNNGQSISFKGEKTPLKGLMLTGQFYQSYEFFVKESGNSYGIALHPTALHKITKLDISAINNKHLPLLEFSKSLYTLLNPIFIKYQENIQKLTEKLIKTILKLPLEQNDFISKIDIAIDLIHAKEGMLNTTDVLFDFNYSQKTLETQFKKIVGITPGKYIRLYRFLKLMRKYESKEINLKDLIYGYNYYDHSHFTKDFKYFMKKSPKDYFNSENEFLNEYLNK